MLLFDSDLGFLQWLHIFLKQDFILTNADLTYFTKLYFLFFGFVLFSSVQLFGLDKMNF